MTKTELEEKIKNGENVWCSKNRTIKQIDLKNTHPIFNGYQIDIMIEDENGRHTEFYGIKDLYKTKSEAEHYLHHANVTRTETLPFLAWEEFLEKKAISFKDYEDYNVYLLLSKSKKYITLFCINFKYQNKYYEATEENFYKAYDECVKLFKGEL